MEREGKLTEQGREGRGGEGTENERKRNRDRKQKAETEGKMEQNNPQRQAMIWNWYQGENEYNTHIHKIAAAWLKRPHKNKPEEIQTKQNETRCWQQTGTELSRDHRS